MTGFHLDLKIKSIFLSWIYVKMSCEFTQSNLVH